MARINIEESLWTDPRFIALSSVLGRWAAIGVMVDAFRIAQGFWVQGKLIPENLWPMYNLPHQIETVGLIERRPEGIYVRGSEEQFAWLLQKHEAGKKGGRPKNPPKISEVKENKDLVKPGDNRGITGDKPAHNPPSLAPSPSQNQKKEEEKIDLSHCFEAWGATLVKFGIHKDPRLDEFTILRIVKTHGVEKAALALRGYGHQQGFDNYNPAKSCRITKLLDPDKFELCVNLGAQQILKPEWELKSDAVLSDK